MESDKIIVTNTGKGAEAAMEQTSAAAAYRGLSGKDALHLRLLAEEMLGMLRQITGETDASFWVASEGRRFELHLLAHPVITGRMRKDLLSVSSTGKNAAAVGVMGKLRDIFERAFDEAEPGEEPGYSRYYLQGMILQTEATALDPMAYALNASLSADVMSWSMQKYRETVEREKAESPEAMEEWDELEKSIVANIADEVAIAIRGGEVEMTVYKEFH